MVKITHTNSVHWLKVLAVRGNWLTCRVGSRYDLISNGDAETIITTYAALPARKTTIPEHDRR